MSGDGIRQLAQALELVARHRQQPSGTDSELLAAHPELRELLEPLLAEPATATDLDADHTLGDFRLVRLLGRGGMGEVHEAVQRSLGRTVALKLLPADRAASPAARARFQREAQLLARLRHDHLVAVHQAGVIDDRWYFAMDLVDGCSLASLIARCRQLPATTAGGERLCRALQLELDAPDAGARLRGRDAQAAAIACLLPIAQALAHVHAHGIVHRDVKPANILLRADGTPLLTDFGLARDSDGPGLTQTGDFAGTPHYVAPEIIADGNKRATPQSDVFALGVTFYELLTLRRPFDGNSTEAVLQRVLRSAPPDPRSLGADCSIEVLAVLDKALQKRPTDRYADMATFAADLQSLHDGRPVSVTRPGPWTRLRRYARREPLRAAFAVALAVLVPSLLWLSGYLLWQRPRIEAAAALERQQQVEALLEAGYLELGEGSPSLAVRRFLAADRIDADRPETLVGLVLAFDRLARHERTLAARNKLQRSHPHLAAELLGLSGDADAARVAGRAVAPTAPTATAMPVDALACYVRGMRWLDYAHGSGDMAAYREAAAALRACIDRTKVARALYHSQYLHVLGHLGEAEPIRAFAAVVAHLWPEAPIPLFWRGFALEDIDRAQARDLLQRSIAARADVPLAHCALARTFEDEDRWQEALACYQRALQVEPDQPIALDGLSRCQVHLGEFAAGLGTAERLLQLVPSSYQGHLSSAAALFELDRLDDGLAAVDRAIELMPTDPECHLLRCRLLAAQGREALALAAAARAAELAPANSEPHLLTAHIHAGLGDRAAARAAMERVVALEPDRALAHLDLGWHCLALGDVAAARAAFTRCIELAPSEARGHDALGLWHNRHGDRDEALRLAQRAVELDPQLGSARVNLASLRWELGDRDGAVQGYRDAVSIAPDLDAAHDGLVFVLQRTGQGTAAIAERRRWADQHPGSPVAWLRLVKTCLDAEPDDLAQATTALERATTAVGGPRADLFYWRARVAERRGDEPAAVRALFEQALAAPKCNEAMRREIEGRLQQGR
ncbi:MAG: protein kinase [Planctomycetes bacterium]|jgi:serine/threonine protein kinase/Tfp pilus assembly protein PilF|nr:protein kinase [Planctomycetota bacterium]